MGYFIVDHSAATQSPSTAPDADPVEVLYNEILEGDHADALKGVDLEAFRVLYRFLYSEAYREAARRLLPVVYFALDWMRTHATDVRYWQAAFAVGAPDCTGWTMTTKALDLGLKSRAAISRGAVMFCENTGLPPSPWMKKEKARKSYRDAREKNLK